MDGTRPMPPDLWPCDGSLKQSHNRQEAVATERERAQRHNLVWVSHRPQPWTTTKSRRILVYKHDAPGHQLEVLLLLLRVRRKNALKPAHISRHRRIESKQARANGERLSGVTQGKPQENSSGSAQRLTRTLASTETKHSNSCVCHWPCQDPHTE